MDVIKLTNVKCGMLVMESAWRLYRKLVEDIDCNSWACPSDSILGLDILVCIINQLSMWN